MPSIHTNWKEVGFYDAFDRLKLKSYEIPTKDYHEVGMYPIIDQGDGLIAGYIDKDGPIENIPFIVFGDHTTIIKYVDQHCFIGSQGVVPLKAKECYDPYFLYLVLGRTRIPALGYSRHFRELENKTFPLPPLAEQRKIAEILRTWDEAIETAEAELKTKQERKRWLMDTLIDRGSLNPDNKNIAVKRCLGEVTSMSSGGTPRTSVAEYYGGKIPWISISDMTSGRSYIYQSKIYITEAGLSNSSAKIFPKGTVLYAMYASIGECRIAGVDLTTSQAILGICPKSFLRSEYLYYFLCRIKESAKSYGQTGTQANLNKGIVQEFEINLPSIDEQDRILEVLKSSDGEIEIEFQFIEQLRNQKRGLMQKLLTGEIRVAA
jgi:restriction endonuclease S subunit